MPNRVLAVLELPENAGLEHDRLMAWLNRELIDRARALLVVPLDATAADPFDRSLLIASSMRLIAEWFSEMLEGALKGAQESQAEAHIAELQEVTERWNQIKPLLTGMSGSGAESHTRREPTDVELADALWEHFVNGFNAAHAWYRS